MSLCCSADVRDMCVRDMCMRADACVCWQENLRRLQLGVDYDIFTSRIK